MGRLLVGPLLFSLVLCVLLAFRTWCVFAECVVECSVVKRREVK